MRKILFIGLIFCPLFLKAQFSYRLEQDIMVEGETGILSLPWGGGLNAAQYNTLDINHDGLEDLVLFDRTANKIITYLNQDMKYVYAPEFEKLFPVMNNWVLLKDFNGDGKKDLFTGDVLGIRVYRNSSTDEGPLAWEPFLFFTQTGQPKSEVLLTKGFSGKINLQLQFDDLPAIADMDNDGDLDIVCMVFGGGSTFEYHQNFSMERYSTCDSLDFERITQNYGDMVECQCGNFAFHGTTCPPSSGGRIEHSGGKTLLAIDIDHDNDQDIVYSEAECDKAFLLTNDGDVANPSFSTSTPFPEAHPVSFHYFPAVFYEDVNFDNQKDIIISPNLFSKDPLDVNFQHSNWFYENTGTTQTPLLSFVQEDFLQEQMIDVGDNAVPAWIDMDHDGDLDLFIGQQTGASISSSITVFKNIGTTSIPSFQYVTNDYLNISSLQLYNLKPQFYDVNSDNKIDLVITATSSVTSLTKLYVMYNTSSTELDFTGQTFNQLNLNMLYSENVHVTDVDQDGLADVLLSKSNGTISYYRNTGPLGSVNLSLSNSSYLNLGPSIELQSLSITSSDLNNDGKAELIVGDIYGKIGIISNFREAGTGQIINNILWDPITETLTSRNLGGRVWTSAADIFQDGKKAIVVGNLLGGLQIMRHEQVVVGNEEEVTGDPSIIIFPNPIHQEEVLHIKTDRPAFVELVTVYGQVLGNPTKIDHDYSITIATPGPGLYILRFLINNKSYSRKLLVR